MTWSGIFRQFVYQYFLSFKGLQNGQTMTRRCNSGSRRCGCAIQPPCGWANIHRLSDFWDAVDASCHEYLCGRNWVIVDAWWTKTHWESWAHSDFSTLPWGHLSLSGHISTLGICPLRDPARKISKNYVVPDYLVLTNIILQNKHISYRWRVVSCYGVLVRHCEASFF